jgi:hypothetical protein
MAAPDLAALETFVAVVDAGGFSRAAERLETTTGAVSRRISALERRPRRDSALHPCVDARSRRGRRSYRTPKI